MEPAHVVTIPCRELDCKQVTVYRDRAEVKRWIKLDLKAGSNEFNVSELPLTIDIDSIRVDGRGDASILAVNFTMKPVGQVEGRQEGLKLLEEQLQSVGKKMHLAQLTSDRIKEQRIGMNNITTNLGKCPADRQTASEQAKSTANVAWNSTPADIDKWLHYFDEKTEQLDVKLAGVKEEIEDYEKSIELLQRKINEFKPLEDSQGFSRQVSILLQCVNEGAVELEVTYLVSGVKWTAFYDVRVSNADKTMKVHYYGKIEQKCGEDWVEAKILLSTAVPGIAGCIPWLPTLNVFKRSKWQGRSMNEIQYETFSTGHAYAYGQSPRLDHDRQSLTDQEWSRGGHIPTVQVALSEVNDSGILTTFEIARPTSIPSGTTDHKVNIGILNLTPTLKHVSVPTLSQTVYMKAYATNTSSYPMLPGPVSVFLDNCFVAKTNMRSVGVKETFSVSLGGDPAVKVQYQHVKDYDTESGFLSKTTTTIMENKVTFNNSRNDTVHLTFFIQIPKPSSDKIKVCIIEPDLKTSTSASTTTWSRSSTRTSKRTNDRAILNKNNLLEWHLSLPSGADPVPFNIKYKVEHAANQAIQFDEDPKPS